MLLGCLFHATDSAMINTERTRKKYLRLILSKSRQGFDFDEPLSTSDSKRRATYVGKQSFTLGT